METKAKAEAMRTAIERADALGELFPAPLEFRGADTAVAGPEMPGAENGDVYIATAIHTCAVGADKMDQTLRRIHSHLRSLGWESSLRTLNEGGDVRAHDPVEGFRYLVMTRANKASLALFVDSPLYRDPDPNTRFRKIRAS